MTPSARPIDALLCNDPVILDDVGLAQLDDTRTELLFRLVAAAYEHTTAVSLLDRLLHHATTPR